MVAASLIHRLAVSMRCVDALCDITRGRFSILLPEKESEHIQVKDGFS